MSSASESPRERAGGAPLSAERQRRNGLVFLLNTALFYLVAPVFYVGVLHAALLKSLNTTDTVANLPAAFNQWVMVLPVVVAWVWPSPRLLAPMLTTSLLAQGAAGLGVAALFLAGTRELLVPALIAHAAVIGLANGVRQMCLWELLGRGLSPEHRAWTLKWTFALTPVLAVVGSCASQLILSGNFLDVVHLGPVPEPWNYVILFGSTGPAMLLAVALMLLVDVPPAPEPESGARVADILRGLGDYCLHPLILISALGFLLTYGGTTIMGNLSLYAQEALGESPEKYAGLQLALRFGFKCLAGFALGWLVARVHARASLVATTALCAAGVVWALLVPGKWYLLSFGFLGAGELFYIYYLNYIVGCSAPERIRENTAYTNLIGMTVGFFPLLFGVVSDRLGLQASFWVTLAVLGLALAVVQLFLPRAPQPPLPETGFRKKETGLLKKDGP